MLRCQPRIPVDCPGADAGLPWVPYVPNLAGVDRGSSDAGDSGYGDR